MSELTTPVQPFPPQTAEAPAFGPKTSGRAVVSGTFGTALEWFDFAVYGTLSATLFPPVGKQGVAVREECLVHE